MYTPHQEFPGGPRLGCWLLPNMFQWINWGSTVKRIVYFKWVFQFKNIMLNHFSTGPPIITDHTLQASEISESEAKLTVCTTSSVYCIAHTGRIISTSLADKTNKDQQLMFHLVIRTCLEKSVTFNMLCILLTNQSIVLSSLLIFTYVFETTSL